MKEEKEITVLVLTSFDNLNDILKTQGFKEKERYRVCDTYMINKDHYDKNMKTLDILKLCVLVRDVKGIEKKLLYKYKEYDSNGDILYQTKTSCTIEDIQSAIKFMEVVGYKTLFTIDDLNIVYENNDMEIAVQLVNEKYIFIEFEYHDGKNKKYASIEKLKSQFNKLSLPILENNYFIKKAELIYNDIYKK